VTQHYEIRVKGHLDLSWSDWLDGITIIHQANGATLLTGTLVDQRALHRLLNRLRHIGIPLRSVSRGEKTPGNSEGDGDEPSR
jgi:hypothetical protein